jgi:hypothetical protein
MLSKASIPVNFAQGLDTKTDPFQVQLGKFLALDNSVFTTGDRLTKRNGYQELPSLPNDTFSYLTTLNGNLTALGTSIGAYSAGPEQWVNKGSIQPMQVSTLPLIRNNVNQTQCDIAIAPNNLVCTVYTETTGSATSYKYAIADSTTGQNIVQPTLIPVSTGVITGSPRVFLVGNFFVIIFTNTISSVTHLQYTSIPVNTPSATPTANEDIASTYTASSTVSWDAVVCTAANNQLYVAYPNSSGINVVYLTQAAISLGQGPTSPTTVTGYTATVMSLCFSLIGGNPYIYVSFYGSDGYTFAVDQNLVLYFAPVEITSASNIVNIASAAQGGFVSVFMEKSQNYSYDAVPTNFILCTNLTITTTTVTTVSFTMLRSVGLASKAFIVNGVVYFLAAYQSPYQPTYFLVNGSTCTETSPVISAKLAYENGGGYLTTGLPEVVVTDTKAQVPYLYKDLIASLSNANSAGTSVVGGVYSQTGINLGTFDITTSGTDSSEIGQVLQFSGGFLWMYDGYLPVEHNFFLYPDNVAVTTSTSGGSITVQEYFYQAVYEWSDNQGNIYRSAGSIPVAITTTGSTSANTINIPTLRLTYKVANPVKITLYRYSAGQEIWYEVTSITTPLLNDTTIDSVTFVDTQADSAITGNTILYTSGGVVEDTNAPATNIMTLFDTRFWMVDAEDQNLLWFSKQVIENTPVEMSDLFTFYIAPTTAAQGSTGPITALSPMDDKLIIFKENAIYYINGTGPDNTGANNQYNQPIFVTSTVGCANQQSIVFMPEGLMFQSGKGIWLLGRDLSTNYIGAPVETYNSSTVDSAVNVPDTNQVRFTLNTGQTLMYDYYYGQWGTFSGVPAISSTLYENLHTFINSSGMVYQEELGTYTDGQEPVLMSFTTSWLNLGGLQGYQRAYFFYILGEYITPHKLVLGIAYNYNPNITQVSTIAPNNYSTSFGSGTSQTPMGQQYLFGGLDNVEQWRVFLAQQRCQAFQITFNEYYDPSFNVSAGAGLTLSGLNIVAGVSKGFRPISAQNSVGGGTNRG